jgi:5-hydroxyisourate hydrolase
MGVTLEPMMPPPYSKSDTKSTFRGEHCLTAKTNADGRIMQWNPEGSASVEGLLSKMKAERSVWRLRFNTGEYFGEGKGFFPEVVVSFFVDVREGGHVHVPLLIGPYSYTTYRGS